MSTITRSLRHLRLAFFAGLAVLFFAAGTSAAEAPISNAAKLEKYQQLKLPELAKRAKANDSWAQFELGSRFNYGRNAPKNNSEALSWLRRAAQNGQPDAQRLLAVKLYNGYDVTVDHDEALLWTQRLAEAGDVPGQMMLGNMYANGEGSPRDLVRAYMWYDIAATVAQQGNGDPALQQAAVDARDKTGALLLPGEEVRAQELASNWWLKKQGVNLAARPAAKAKSASRKTAKPKTPAKAGKMTDAKSNKPAPAPVKTTPTKPAAKQP